MSETSSFLDYLRVLARRRKTVAGSVIAAGLITAVLSFLVPVWYRADTTIMPPLESSSGLGLSSFLSNLPVSGLSLPGSDEGTNRFLAILESRTVRERIAVRFDLQQRYSLKNMEETVDLLAETVSADLQEDNTIIVSAMAGTGWLPGRADKEECRRTARDISNAFIEELDIINRELKAAEAQNTRRFIESRHAKVTADLSAAEDSLKRFQKENGLIALPEQAAAAIATAAELKAQIIAKEVELDYLQRNFSRSHSEFTKKQQEMTALQSAYRRFRFGTGYGVDSGQSDHLSLHELPDKALTYGRLFREVLLQEKILEFILPQLEQAKIQEARDSPTVQVLDRAVVPEKKVKPKRLTLTFLAMLFAGIISGLWALLQQNIDNHRSSDSESWRKWRAIKNELTHEKK